MKLKILVTGDRTWSDSVKIIDAYEMVCEKFGVQATEVWVIHGAARGADTLAAQLAEELGMTAIPYPAHWCHTKYCSPKCRRMVGRPAGVIRNQQMLDENPDIQFALAFHSDLAHSKGTKDMVNRLEKAKIPYCHYK